jgi:hypothetical protein
MPVDPWDINRRPHCWPVGQACPNRCAQAHYDHVVHNHVELAGPWAGWRLAGKYLIGPGNRRSAPRISLERLRGLLWREEAEARAAAARAANSGHRGKVVALINVRKV